MMPMPTPSPARSPIPAPGAAPISTEALQAWFASRRRRRRRLKVAVLALLIAGVAAASVVWTFFHEQLVAMAHLKSIGFAVDWELNKDNLLRGGTTSVSYPIRWGGPSGYVTARDLESLASLRHLTTLDLANVPVLEDDLAVLARLDEVTELVLDRSEGRPGIGADFRARTRLSDRALEHIAVMKGLTSLSLGYNAITDVGLVRLKDMPALRSLDLGHTLVTDAGLKSLANLKSLETIDLEGTRVTDAGLATLKGLKNLKAIRVEKTAVTDEGVARFQGIRPDVQVVREQPPDSP